MMERGLILPTPINEHDVFEALKECGFEYKLVSFQHITDDQELISYGYRWPSQRDELGLVILTALERKMTTEGCSELKTWKGKSITHSFPVELSLSQFEKKGFYIFNDKIHYMQTFIDNHFRNSLYRTAVINYNHFNIPYKDSILTFLATYGIDEEDFPYESIRKDFNRKAEVIRKRLAK